MNNLPLNTMKFSSLPKCPLALLFVAFSFCLHAQDDGPPAGEKPDTAWFGIKAPEHKVVHNLYRSIDFIDQRPDTVTLGIFTTNTYYDIPVLPAYPLGLEFDNLLAGMTDATAGEGVLLLQLRRFTIYDIDTRFTHKVASSLRAVL